MIACVAALLLALGGASSEVSSDTVVWSSTESAIAAGVVAGTLAMMPLDEDIRDFAPRLRSRPSRYWAAGAKTVGDGYVTLPAAGAMWWLGAQGRFPRLARASRDGLEAWCLTELVVQVVKYSTHRERPTLARTSQEWHGFGITDKDLSMPSGHSSSAWGLLTAYALEYSDHPWLAASIYAVAASTSLSRVHDEKHWMSDVVMGAGIGYLSNRLVRNWNARRDARMVLVPQWGPDRAGVVLALEI